MEANWCTSVRPQSSLIIVHITVTNKRTSRSNYTPFTNINLTGWTKTCQHWTELSHPPCLKLFSSTSDFFRNRYNMCRKHPVQTFGPINPIGFDSIWRVADNQFEATSSFVGTDPGCRHSSPLPPTLSNIPSTSFHHSQPTFCCK